MTKDIRLGSLSEEKYGICSLCGDIFEVDGYQYEEQSTKDYVCGCCDCEQGRWEKKPEDRKLKNII